VDQQIYHLVSPIEIEYRAKRDEHAGMRPAGMSPLAQDRPQFAQAKEILYVARHQYQIVLGSIGELGGIIGSGPYHGGSVDVEVAYTRNTGARLKVTLERQRQHLVRVDTGDHAESRYAWRCYSPPREADT
jgi:hypothetical protein